MKYIKPFKIFEAESSASFSLPSWGNISDYLFNAATAASPFAIGAMLIKSLLPATKDNAKIRFIFPEKDWEATALGFLKKLGLVTSIFKNWTQASEEAKKYVESGVKAKELVIGSHGDGQFLIMPQKSAQNIERQQQFLSSLKPLIKSDTTVFFTACHGADFLHNLADAAGALAHPAYGSAGIYNYVTNASENGYYVCSPLPADYKKEQVRLEKREPILQYAATSNNGLFSFVKGGTSAKVEVVFSRAFLVKIGCTKVPPEGATASFSLADGNDLDDRLKLVDRLEYADDKGLPLHRFSLPSLYVDTDETSGWPFARLKKERALDFPYISSSTVQTAAAKSFASGGIIVKVDGVPVSPKEIGVKKILQYHRDVTDLTTNAELLKRGICKKVSKAPISWLEPGTI